MAERVLVTGATGNVGREVVRSLLRRGLGVRAADFDVNRVRATFGETVESVHLDFLDPSTFPDAMNDCDALFLLRPPAIADMKRTLNPLVDAAWARGLTHVVFLSVAGAGKNKLVPHHAVEKHLAEGRINWTVLRPGFFAQNFGDAYRRDLTNDRRVYVPAGRGRVAFVDVRDVADVAALAFADPGPHAGKAYTLTGPRAFTFEEAASLLTEILGEPVRYEPASVLGYLRHLHGFGMPRAQVAIQAILHVGLRYGQAEAVDPTLARLLGREGRALPEYLRDHVSLWQRSPGPSDDLDDLDLRIRPNRPP